MNSSIRSAGVGTLLLGTSPQLSALRASISRIAPTDLSVLIEGPTGAGKELVAQSLHEQSPGRLNLVSVNVSAIAESMFEDTLFGHIRGAFTGAISHSDGLLGEAHRGTLFLDEIGTLSLSLQPKLLRVLESRRYRQVGGRQDRESDFRLVAASNSSLATAVREGAFRADLYQRLSPIILRIPSLSERRSDIPQLAQYFASSFAARHSRHAILNDSALQSLCRYDWPGNVRELKNVVESALAFADRHVVSTHDIERALEVRIEANGTRDRCPLSRDQLLSTLVECDYDTLRTAAAHDVSRATVYRWMQMLGIDVPRRVRTRTTDSAERYS